MRKARVLLTVAATVVALGLSLGAAAAPAANTPKSLELSQPTPYERAYDADGTASWYGAAFHGRRDARGERFDQNALTAAHRTLPLNSFVEVTNLRNGRSVVVRITDRGPYAGHRLIDLSRAAANELGYIDDGTARVNVRSLAAADAPEA